MKVDVRANVLKIVSVWGIFTVKMFLDVGWLMNLGLLLIWGILVMWVILRNQITSENDQVWLFELMMMIIIIIIRHLLPYG